MPFYRVWICHARRKAWHSFRLFRVTSVKEERAKRAKRTLHTYTRILTLTHIRARTSTASKYVFVCTFVCYNIGWWVNNKRNWIFFSFYFTAFVCSLSMGSTIKKIHRVDVLTCIKLHACYLFILLTVWDSAHSISTSWNWRFNRFLLRKSYLSYVQSLKIKLLANGTN